MENQSPYKYEDEIDLREIVRILIKRKNLILISTFISLLFGVLWTFMEKYEVSALIEPAIYGIQVSEETADAKLQYISQPDDLQNLIKTASFLSVVGSTLSTKGRNLIRDLKVDRNRMVNYVKISIQCSRSLVGNAIDVINEVYNQICKILVPVIENRKKELEIIVKNIEIEIDKYEIEIQNRKKNLQILESREKDLLNEIDSITKNTDNLIHQRENLLKMSKGEEIAVLLYTTTIQQNISHHNNLNNELSGLLSRKEELKTQIQNIQRDIEQKKVEVDKTYLAIDNVRNAQFVVKPAVSLFSVSPSATMKIAIALILGLTLSLFLAIFMEFLESNYISSSHTIK